MRAAVGLSVLICVLAGCGDLTTAPKRKAPVKSASTVTAPTAVNLDPRRFGGSANFITNPSFEHGLSPWVAGTANTVLQLSNAEHKDGTTSARVTTGVPAAYGIQLGNIVALPAVGDRFEFTIWARSADRPKRLTITLVAYLRRGAEVVARASPTIGTSWKQLKVGGVVHGRLADSISASLTVANTISAGDAFFVDGAFFGIAP